jgi:hypothetical protein
LQPGGTGEFRPDNGQQTPEINAKIKVNLTESTHPFMGDIAIATYGARARDNRWPSRRNGSRRKAERSHDAQIGCKGADRRGSFNITYQLAPIVVTFVETP